MASKKSSWGQSSYGWYQKSPAKPKPEAGTGIRGGGKFGTTWWGQQWLAAFNHISDSNRLPRGRTYANNGSVRDIKIKANSIAAEVQGSYLYKVDIVVPSFSQADQKKVTDILLDRPDLLSRLLNRELPEEVNQACADHGIYLFPRKWSDIKARCSCPDSAMPCKHLAAIIYLVANEIDKNPFKVFELHDFDLPVALKSAGFSASDIQTPSFAPALTSLWQEAKPPSTELPEFDPALLEKLDFSTLTDLRNNLATILPDKPVFYPEGDFKGVLKKAWTQVAKQVANTEYAAAEPDFDFQSVDRLEIVFDDLASPLCLMAFDGEGELALGHSEVENWMAWLAAVPPGRLAQLPEDVCAIWFAWRFAEALAQQGALVPQLLAANNSHYLVRWLPALLDETVASLYQTYARLVRPGLITLEVNGQTMSPVSQEGPILLLSAFLNHFVQQYHGQGSSSSPILQLFFEGKSTSFTRFEQQSYPMAIGLWMSCFFMAEKDFVPMLEVEEYQSGSFEVNVRIDDKTEPMAPPAPLAEVFTSEKWAAKRLELLRDLSNLGAYFPALRQLLATKGKTPLRYAARDFANILLQTLPVIQLFGIRVLLPKSLRHILRPQLSMKLRSTTNGTIPSDTGISMSKLLAYDWQVALGSHFISNAEFSELLKTSQGLVEIRGEYIYLDPNETKALAEQLAKPPALSGPELLQVALSEEYEGVGVQLTPELHQIIQQLLNAPPLPLPQGLQAKLRPYQQRGYDWLCKNARIGFGSILADDMGLGKTLQVITTLLRFKEEGVLNPDRRALVVAPTTLITNWQREIARFAPTLSIAIYHGPNRSMKDFGNADIVLTSYGAARSDVAKLDKQAWAVLVIDEAQNIKNPAAEQTKAIKKINADVRIAMSGTPVENRMSEYWSIFDFTNKGYLGGLKHFKEKFAAPIERDRDQRTARHFRKSTLPFVLRRLKTDKTIINDLPDKVERNQYASLTPEQAALYQHEVEQAMKAIETSEGIQRKGLVLNLIMSLKQICNHPAQYLKKGAPDPALSGKCPLLLDLLKEALENDEKVLIFTQFREMGELLAKIIQTELKQTAPFLHGGLTRAARDCMVEDFQNKISARILLVSLKAGGTGLNLTAASQVIHFDLWWNPAVEAQATDRAFRIGQKRNVQVHRFVTTATFEEKIDEMIQKKKELANLAVGTGETWIGDLSNKDLRSLFALSM